MLGVGKDKREKFVENLLPWDRDDFYYKIAFARSLLAGDKNAWARIQYREHIFFWNGFLEKQSDAFRAEKVGVRSFEKSFKRLVDSISKQGLILQKLSESEKVQGLGSHRLAALLATSELRGSQELEDLASISWDESRYSFGYFHGLGISPRVTREAVLEKMKLFKDIPVTVLLIWPTTDGTRKLVMERVSAHFGHSPLLGVQAFLEIDSVLSLSPMSTLITGNNWSPIGLEGLEVESHEGDSDYAVTALVIPPRYSGELLSFTKAVSDLGKFAENSVSISSNWKNAYQLFESISSPEALINIDSKKSNRYDSMIARENCERTDSDPRVYDTAQLRIICEKLKYFSLEAGSSQNVRSFCQASFGPYWASQNRPRFEKRCLGKTDVNFHTGVTSIHKFLFWQILASTSRARIRVASIRPKKKF